MLTLKLCKVPGRLEANCVGTRKIQSLTWGTSRHSTTVNKSAYLCKLSHIEQESGS